MKLSVIDQSFLLLLIVLLLLLLLKLLEMTKGLLDFEDTCPNDGSATEEEFSARLRDSSRFCMLDSHCQESDDSSCVFNIQRTLFREHGF